MLVARVRVELTFRAYETRVLPLDDLAIAGPSVSPTPHLVVACRGVPPQSGFPTAPQPKLPLGRTPPSSQQRLAV